MRAVYVSIKAQIATICENAESAGLVLDYIELTPKEMVRLRDEDHRLDGWSSMWNDDDDPMVSVYGIQIREEGV